MYAVAMDISLFFPGVFSPRRISVTITVTSSQAFFFLVGPYQTSAAACIEVNVYWHCREFLHVTISPRDALDSDTKVPGTGLA